MQGFEHIVLENSYVLGVNIEPYRVEFRMDFVLAPQHPRYEPPKVGEQECYRRGVIRVVDFRTLVWRASTLKPSADAAGELDYGCLDEMVKRDAQVVFLGDWGQIEVSEGQLIFRLDT